MCSIVHDVETIYGLSLILYTIVVTMCSIVHDVEAIYGLLLILYAIDAMCSNVHSVETINCLLLILYSINDTMCSIVHDVETIYGLLLILYTIGVTICDIVNDVEIIYDLLLILYTIIITICSIVNGVEIIHGLLLILLLIVYCRIRPSHVLLTSFLSRSTCLCTKHQNMALTLKTMRKAGVTTPSNPESYLKEPVKSISVREAIISRDICWAVETNRSRRTRQKEKCHENRTVGNVHQ